VNGGLSVAHGDHGRGRKVPPSQGITHVVVEARVQGWTPLYFSQRHFAVQVQNAVQVES
jgi:hypothetical protein